MYNKILVPMALNHGISKETLEIARALRAPNAKITALHVYEVPNNSVATLIGEETVQKGYEAAYALLKQKTDGMEGVTPEITRGQAYRAIIDHAVENDYDCIVIGSHKPGLSDYLIGSTAAKVVRHAPCAVHVHRDT